MKKSIQKSTGDTTVPEREPLDEFATSIFDAANYANGDTEMMLTIINAVGVAAEFDNMAERHDLVHKLQLIQGLAKVGKYLGDDLLQYSRGDDCRLHAGI